MKNFPEPADRFEDDRSLDADWASLAAERDERDLEAALDAEDYLEER